MNPDAYKPVKIALFFVFFAGVSEINRWSNVARLPALPIIINTQHVDLKFPPAERKTGEREEEERTDNADGKEPIREL